MQAEVKSIMSPDIFDFQTFYPKDSDCFSFLLQVVVGVRGEEGGDTFNVEVCTPQWLIQNYETENIILGRGKLIVFEYHIERILKKVRGYCESITGSSWEEIANKISYIGLWEFENYKSK